MSVRRKFGVAATIAFVMLVMLVAWKLGAGTPILKATTITAGTIQTLSATVAQKGTAGSLALNGPLARIALDLKSSVLPGAVTLTFIKAQVLGSTGTVSATSISTGALAAQ